MTDNVITSTSNSLVKMIRSIASCNRRAQEQGRHIVEGVHSVQEYLTHNPAMLDMVLVSAESRDGIEIQEILRMARSRDIPVHLVRDGIVNSIASARNLGTCLALGRNASRDPFWLEKILVGGEPEKESPYFIWMHEIANPANLGAIYRLSRAFGARAVILTGNHVFPFSAHAVRASQGASCRIDIVSGFSEPQEAMQLFQANSVRVYATLARGSSEPWMEDFSGPSCFLFGPESSGLPQSLGHQADRGITIPMVNQTESLSVVQAVTVLGYERIRQTLVS